jgi:hypothetical protein
VRPLAGWWPIALFLVALGGCAIDDEPDETEEVGQADATSCADAPTITWETFGEGFVTTHCQGCHASLSPDRRDAPDNVVFDEEADVLRMKTAILESAGTDEPTMPPTGGTSEEERLKLRIWLRCFAD